MGLPLKKYEPVFTVDQYLEIDRASEDRYIFLDGEIFLMAGESDAHGIISVNLTGLLHRQLEDKPCQVRAKDAKVRSGETPMPGGSTKGLFSYPDVLVICEEPDYHDSYQDVLLNC